MQSTPKHIVEMLTQAIVEHRLQPGTHLVEQKLADHFGVSHALLGQALYQLEQKRLVVIDPSNGAFIASPTVQEAQQVFEVRRMLESEMVRLFVRQINPAHIRALRDHLMQEKEAISHPNAAAGAPLRGDFHVLVAQLLGNSVLEQLLRDLVSRCALITLMYKGAQDAQNSNHEHIQIVSAMVAKDEAKAAELMEEHLFGEMSKLALDRSPASHEETMVFQSSYMATVEAHLATMHTPL
jgi:DNA-binding GntR family transcriptional regulator